LSDGTNGYNNIKSLGFCDDLSVMERSAENEPWEKFGFSYWESLPIGSMDKLDLFPFIKLGGDQTRLLKREDEDDEGSLFLKSQESDNGYVITFIRIQHTRTCSIHCCWELFQILSANAEGMRKKLRFGYWKRIHQHEYL